MNTPSHEKVAQRAQQIWQNNGSPSGHDTEIWLEAERQLAAEESAMSENSSAYENSRTVSESKGAAALADRMSAGQAMEGAVEHVHSSPMPAEDAVKTNRQKKEARAPKLPAKNAPKPTPPESGKPLWNQPHSS